MKNGLFVMALVGVMSIPAATVLADETDFVGYSYSQNTKRDYDRGFFFSAEAWGVEPRNIGFEPVLDTNGMGLGGRLLDVAYDRYQVSPVISVGYQANRRLGRFTLRYWDFNHDTDRESIGGVAGPIFYATDTHPTRGVVARDSFEASLDTDVAYGEAEWRKNFAEGRKFNAYYTVAAQGWEVELQTDSWHFNAASAMQQVHVQEFSKTKGLGGKVGFGGNYQFNDRFSMGAYLGIGYSSTVQDAFYIDENIPGSPVAFIDRQNTKLTTLQYEGDLDFRLRVAGGFDIDWGYRYLQMEKSAADDRFTDNEGTFSLVATPHDLSFEGPYIRATYTVGLKKIDSDGDGVLDVYDDCPDTPSGAWVNEKGCPRDLDEDGVYDGIDRCPGTDFGTRVDEWGCGVDSDGDGVPDGLDLCPNTPGCAHVDAKGCPKDSDGDGVSDGCDACPQTPAGAKVDSNGCQTDMDSDGDTVPDSRDKCPGTPRGAKVDADGCEMLVTMTLHFPSDSAVISDQDKGALEKIAAALVADGGTFEVAGHCDWQNTEEYNQVLSEKRAGAVKDFLVAHGVPADHLKAVGYSKDRPIATNETDAGRAMNRRVEIVRR